MKLHSLQNPSKPFKRTKRIGRGVGSKRGKTSCRGQKGAGSRSGWRARARYEGGQLPLYRKLPERGFSNVQFTRRYMTINLGLVNDLFQDGEVVNVVTLRAKGLLKGKPCIGLKVLANGELKKSLKIEAKAFSQGAITKIEQAKGSYTIV